MPHSYRSIQSVTVALACATALGLRSTPASASAHTLGQAVHAVTSGGELPEQAMLHLGKAYDHFNASAYGKAESEFKRAAFFAPKWAPMTYNLAVVAEAQGHIGDALERYKAYRPEADGDTRLIIDQRIAELEDRKRQLKKTDRRQLILGSTALATGAAALGGGIALLVLAKKEKDKALPDGSDKSKNYYTGGYVLTVYGGLALIYSGLYLAKVVKQRKAKKLALRPTHDGVAIIF